LREKIRLPETLRREGKEGREERRGGRQGRTFFAAENCTKGMNKVTNKMKSVEVESKNPAEMVAKTAEEMPKYALDKPATCPVTSLGKI
jgi:hypothetical protein